MLNCIVTLFLPDAGRVRLGVQHYVAVKVVGLDGPGSAGEVLRAAVLGPKIDKTN
jgi:hypothetical protein